MFFGNPTVADVDGDGRPEVVSANGGGFVHAFSPTGGEPAGWPKFTNGWMIPIPPPATSMATDCSRSSRWAAKAISTSGTPPERRTRRRHGTGYAATTVSAPAPSTRACRRASCRRMLPAGVYPLGSRCAPAEPQQAGHQNISVRRRLPPRRQRHRLHESIVRSTSRQRRHRGQRRDPRRPRRDARRLPLPRTGRGRRYPQREPAQQRRRALQVRRLGVGARRERTRRASKARRRCAPVTTASL